MSQQDRILIADDHALFRDSLRSLLESQDIEVVGEAKNGQEAVDLSWECKPDVVLMDLTMPEMDGLEATKRIAAELPEVKVVILTASDEDNNLFEAIKSRTDAKLFYHGCGAVYDLIPHLIEIGVDIINPVQVNAEGMDSAALKKAYGDDIVFWGGGVDTQKTLAFGTADEVYREVRERIDVFNDGGGFVFNTIHNIQARTPVENIVAMLDAVREFDGSARA